MQAIKYGDACLITNPIAMSFQENTMESASLTSGDKIFVVYRYDSCSYYRPT